MKPTSLDLLIIIPPPWGTHLPALGAAYLSANLRYQGITTEIYDLNLECYEQANAQQKQHWDLNAINCFSPAIIGQGLFNDFRQNFKDILTRLETKDVIAFSITSHISCAFSAELAGHIKNIYPEKIVIFGGPGCYFSYDRKFVSKGNVNFFIIGEGEHTLLRLLKILSEKGKTVNIPGVIRANGNDLFKFIPAEPIKNLDELRHPDFSEFNLSRYQRNLPEHRENRALPILMSRGCVNRCSFCIDCYMQGAYRCRSPKKVFDEIIFHINNNQTHRFEFNDLLCNGNLKNLSDLCELIIKNNIKITWSSYAMIHPDMGKGLLEKMRAAGCVSLCYGLESAADKILGLMNKRYKSADVKKLLMATKAAEISTHINIIVGFPQETADDFNRTKYFLSENKDYIDCVANVSNFVLMPSSDVGTYPRQYGIERVDGKLNWVDQQGLTLEKRLDRLREISVLIRDLNIANNIVNTKTYIEEEDKSRKLSVDNESITVLPEDGIFEIRPGNIFLETIRKNKVYRLLVILFLFLYTIIMDSYLYLLTRVRKSIIFPGG